MTSDSLNGDERRCSARWSPASSRRDSRLRKPARVASVVVLFAGESEHDEPAAQSFFDEMRRLEWVEATNINHERLRGVREREYVEAGEVCGRPYP